MIHACYRAALAGCHVLIMCPTGTLVHSYRDRVPDHPDIVIETIHSALVIKRQYDSAVQYAPPSRLRRYDLIMIDEVPIVHPRDLPAESSFQVWKTARATCQKQN